MVSEEVPPCDHACSATSRRPPLPSLTASVASRVPGAVGVNATQTWHEPPGTRAPAPPARPATPREGGAPAPARRGLDPPPPLARAARRAPLAGTAAGAVGEAPGGPADHRHAGHVRRSRRLHGHRDGRP